MHIAAALSRTPEAGLAAAEAADAVAVALDATPRPDAAANDHPALGCDLAVVFATAEHADALGDVAAAVEARLEPGVLLGAVAQGVIGPGEEVEDGAGVVVWAASLPGAQLEPFRSWSVRSPEGGLAVAGWPDTGPDDVTMVLADPYSYPTTEVLGRIGQQRPGHVVTGGLVTAGPGRSALVLDDRVHEDGAVGVVLRDLAVRTVVSQGCRPVGEPLTITAGERNRVLELGGEPAVARLREVLETADADDRALLQRGGLHIGLVAEEVRDDYGTGDFVIRGVLGVDTEHGALTIGDLARVGRTVQFQVRDARSAHEDLITRLDHVDAAAGGLLFSCNGRGRRLFGRPDHDVEVVCERIGTAVAGAFCAGEIGPVGARSYVHGFTASLAAFGATVAPETKMTDAPDATDVMGADDAPPSF